MTPGERHTEEKLLFIARAAAIMSHELRNALATVQQSAGLLDDLVMMIERGSPVGPERWGETASRIGRGAVRGLHHTDLLHWLGHAQDPTAGWQDLDEIARHTAVLVGYDARSRAVTVEARPFAGEPSVAGVALDWALLMYRCLGTVVQRSRDGAIVQMGIEEIADHVILMFETDATAPAETDEAPAKELIASLCDSLGGQIEAWNDPTASGRIALRLPRGSTAPVTG